MQWPQALDTFPGLSILNGPSLRAQNPILTHEFWSHCPGAPKTPDWRANPDHRTWPTGALMLWLHHSPLWSKPDNMAPGDMASLTPGSQGLCQARILWVQQTDNQVGTSACRLLLELPRDSSSIDPHPPSSSRALPRHLCTKAPSIIQCPFQHWDPQQVWKDPSFWQPSPARQ